MGKKKKKRKIEAIIKLDGTIDKKIKESEREVVGSIDSNGVITKYNELNNSNSYSKETANNTNMPNNPFKQTTVNLPQIAPINNENLIDNIKNSLNTNVKSNLIKDSFQKNLSNKTENNTIPSQKKQKENKTKVNLEELKKTLYTEPKKDVNLLENVGKSSLNLITRTGKGTTLDFPEQLLDVGLQIGSSERNPVMHLTNKEKSWDERLKDTGKSMLANAIDTTPIGWIDRLIQKVNPSIDDDTISEKLINSIDTKGIKNKQKIAEEIIKKDASQSFMDKQLGYGKKLSNGKTIQETLDEGALIKSDNIGGKVAENIGQMLPSLMTGNEGTSLLTMGVNSYGGGVEEAYNNGATRSEATKYGLLNAAIETGTEKMFAGIGGVFGKGALDDVVKKGIQNRIKSELGKQLVDLGIDALGEGTEELMSDILNPLAQKLTYASEKDLKKLYEDQNFTEDFVMGALSSLILKGTSIPAQNSINNKLKNEIKDSINENNSYEIIKKLQKQGYTQEQSLQLVNKALKETGQLQINVENAVQNKIAQQNNTNTPQILQETRQNQKLSNETIKPSQIIEPPKNSIKNYTENDINRFSTGNNLIDGVNSDLKSFTEKFYDKENKRAKKKKAPIKSQKMFLGRISDALSTKINSLLNNSGRFSQKYETKDTNIVISSDNIEHIYNHHGNEKMSGQIDITPENLSKYVEVVSNPDYIGLSSQLSRGNTPTLYFTKKINGYSVAVEVLSTKKQLYPQSYYVFDSNSEEYTDFIKNNKLKKAWDVESSGSKSLDINVHDDTSAAFTDNNVTTKTKKSQIAPISSQYSMQQNQNNDTKKVNAPVVKEQNNKANTSNDEIYETKESDALKIIPKNPTKEASYDIPKKITRKSVREEMQKQMGITAEDLSIGKDIKSINYQLTDPIRVNEKVFGRELGNKINDETIRKTTHNEAKKIKWLNSERNDIKELGIKPRSKESAAVQKYGEKKYLNKYGESVSYGDKELIAEFPNVKTQKKIKRAAGMIRNKYDKYIDDINQTLTALGYDAIPKREDYMRHFQELGDIFSKTGVPFNLNDMKVEDLPTDINGLTEFNRPGKNYFASAQRRIGEKTVYDAITGIDGYLEGAGNLIYHTGDIQRYRALSSLIRDSFGSSKGFDNLGNLTDTQAEQRINDILDNKLSRYAAWLDEQANNLAGKKGAMDRGAERLLGRKVYTGLNTIKKQVGSNMTGFNARSAMTNLISSTIASAKTNKLAFVKGTVSTINNMFKNDGFIEKSDFLTTRFGSDQLSKKLWQKASNAGQIFMTGTDYFTANQITRSKYYEGLQKGMLESDAIKYADDFASRVMGDRSLGRTAEAFNSKTLGLLTQFQLEVNNQWQYMIHDTKMDFQKNYEINNGLKAGATALFQMGQLAAFSYFFNELFQSLTGSRAAFDPIDIFKKLFGSDDDEDKPWDERISEANEELFDNIPFGNLLTGGGRIPISEAFTGLKTFAKKTTGQKNQYGGDITWRDVKDDTLATIPYYFLPTGYSQIKKTKNGLSMFRKDKEIKGSYTKSGRLRFPVKDTAKNRIQAGLFGEYSSSEARKYFDEKRSALTDNQQQMYKALKIPVSDYWKINKQISYIKNELKGTDTPTEKRKEKFFKYIDSLDVSKINKSILKKSIYKSYKDDDYEIKKYIDSSNMSKQSKKELLEKLALNK